MAQDKILLIRQALAAAESSIKTAKQLLSEVESGGLKPSAKDLPGEEGVFDGTGMVTEAGEHFDIPENYASKSMLVIGDTLKLVEEDGEKRFKQIEHVKRLKTQGILHKKDGKWKVITPEGSYNVLSASIEHFKGEVGDGVTLHLPASSLTSAYGAVEMIQKKGAPAEDEVEKKEVKPEPPKPAPKAVSKPPLKPKPPVRTEKRTDKRPAPEPAKIAPATPAKTPPPVTDDELR
jgi:hypothetical protein